MLLTPGLITALAFIILLFKMRHNTMRKLLGFDIYLDVVATIIMMILFAGTYTGMMAAMIGGLVFSLSLVMLKKTMGYKKLTRVNDSDHLLPTLRWVDVPPMWSKQSAPANPQREAAIDEALAADISSYTTEQLNDLARRMDS